MNSNNRFVREIKISSCAISRADLSKLFHIANVKTKEAADLEIKDWRLKPGDTDVRKFENAKTFARGLFEVSIVIQGVNGDVRSGSGAGMLTSDNLPDRISSIYFTSSATFLASQKTAPRASLVILMDFKKPALLDFSSPASSPTLNASSIKVESDDESWTNATFQKIKEFFEERDTNRNFLHRTNVYDFGLVIIGFPCSFWAVWKVIPMVRAISVDENTGVLRSALYIYVFIAILWLYRIIFSYAKWTFPLLEIDSPKNRPAAHRAILAVIVLGVVGSFAYDLIKAVF